MIFDLVLEAGITGGLAPGWRSRMIDRPLGMIRRVQTNSTRLAERNLAVIDPN